jgi:hypothetical protein
MGNNVSHAVRASRTGKKVSIAVIASTRIPKVDRTWRYTMFSEHGGGNHEGTVNFTSEGTSVSGLIDVWDNSSESG